MDVSKLVMGRLAALYLLLGVVLGAAGWTLVDLNVTRTVSQSCAPVPTIGPEEAETGFPAAQETARRFVYEAVLRRNPGCAYALSGPDLRQNKTAKDWAEGHLSVIPFPSSHPVLSLTGMSVDPQIQQVVRVTEDGRYELPLWIGIVDPGSGERAVFSLVLTLRGESWVVTSFGAPVMGGGVSGPSQRS